MSKRKSNNYWNDRKNIEGGLRKLIDVLGHFPTAREMRKAGVPNLPRVTIKEFGSFERAREYLGCATGNVRKRYGYWKNSKNIRLEARMFMEENPDFNTIPRAEVLHAEGHSTLGKAIGKEYEGGFEQLRLDLGFKKRGYLKDGQWKDLEFTLEEAKRVMQERSFETLPDNVTLQRLGYSSLSAAITKYHGGFRKFRDILGQKQIQREKGVWKDLDFTINQAKKFLDENPEYQELPPGHILEKEGYSSLVNAINRYHGGIPLFRKELNQYLGRNPEEARSLLEVYVGGNNND